MNMVDRIAVETCQESAIGLYRAVPVRIIEPPAAIGKLRERFEPGKRLRATPISRARHQRHNLRLPKYKQILRLRIDGRIETLPRYRQGGTVTSISKIY